MASIFTKIIQGEIPSHKIAEDSNFLAFLDIHPAAKGHTLVVPKEEIDYFFDLSEQVLSDMMVFARKVAIAIREAISCERVGVVVAGFEVPHAHLHLIPSNSMADLDFSHKLNLSHEELAQIAEQIQSKL